MGLANHRYPAEKIIQLARKSAVPNRRLSARDGGPQRHANGEIATRAISMLAILTGTSALTVEHRAREGSYSLPFVRMPTLENPLRPAFSMFTWTDAIERGPEMTALRDGVRGKDKLDAPIKMILELCR